MSSRKSKEDTWTEAELLKVVKPKDETRKHSSSERHRRKEHGDGEKRRKRDRTETYDVEKSEKKDGEIGEKSSATSQRSSGSHDRKREGRIRDQSKNRSPKESTRSAGESRKDRSPKESTRSAGESRKDRSPKESARSAGESRKDRSPKESTRRTAGESRKDRSPKESARRRAGESQKSRSHRDGKEKYTREKESKKESGQNGKSKKYEDEKRQEYGKEKVGKGVKYKLSENYDIGLEYEGNGRKHDDKEENESGQQSSHTTAVPAETEYNYDDDEFDDYDDDFEDDSDAGDDASESKDDDNDEDGSDDKHGDEGLSDIEDNALVNKKSSELFTNEKSGDLDKVAVSSFNKGKERPTVDLNKSRDIPGDERNVEVEAYGDLNMNDVVKAIYAENEKVNSSSSNNSRPSTSTKKVEPEHGKIKDSHPSAPTQSTKKLTGKINFVAASQKQQNDKAALKTKQRGEELLKLVQLDIRSIDLFDMAPMSEYELYMKRFGQSGCTQVSTQTRDDDVAQNTQTEEVETNSKWCQCSHELKSCGTDDELNSSGTYNPVLNLNTSRLNRFLLKASQMMLSLFSELDAGIEQHQKQYTELKTKLSDGFVTLPIAPQLSSTSFVDLSYSSSHASMLLAAYSKSHLNGVDSSHGVVSVWNTNDPTGPSTYLSCESAPTCCCFSSSSPLLVFAGMEDGVLCLWDLREPLSLHEKEDKDRELVQRTPTYTTSASNDNHGFPVVALSPLLANSFAADGGGSGEVDMSFQLLSLDEGGTFNVWIIIEIHADVSDMSNMKEDLGLSARGSVKLVKSSCFNVFSASQSLSNMVSSALCVQVDNVQPNHIYVGMDNGNVQHVLRFGSRPVPKVFQTIDKVGNKVNSIDVSPWKLPYFLTGCDDGSVSLFHNQRTMPIWKTICSENSIIKIKWSQSRACIFLALDSEGTIYVWDIFQSNFEPIYKQQITRKEKKVIDFALANNCTIMAAGTVVRDAEMAIVYDDSSIEIHRLTNGMSVMDPDELDRLDEYLGNII